MKKQFFVLFTFLSFTACSDFLEVPSNEFLSIDEQFKDYSGSKIALAGVYFKLEDWYASQSNFIYADVMGGNLTFTPRTTGSNAGIISVPTAIIDFYNFNDISLESNFTTYYADAYSIINNANNVINFADNLPDATTIQKNQLKAEALAARAFIHYNLLQMYGQTFNFSVNANHKGIVYADKILVGGVDFPARKTVAESYTLIVADLQNALLLFSNQQSLSGPSYSYFNTITTKAFLARVALQKRDWILAITMANEVISSSGTSLISTTNYISEWEKPNLPPSETLLEFSAPTDATIPNFITRTVATLFKVPFSGTDNPGNYTCSSDLYALFADDDVRKNNFTTINLQVKDVTGQFAPKPFYFTKKFQDNAGTMVMRLSEMHLIVAEAYARQNNVLALNSLNIIRQRANLAALTSTTNILDEILLERRKELCFEGHLFFDLARFNKNIVRSACLGLQCNLTFPNPKMVLPIPFSSIKVNQNIIQNESY
jgi:hypothetical protein